MKKWPFGDTCNNFQQRLSHLDLLGLNQDAMRGTLLEFSKDPDDLADFLKNLAFEDLKRSVKRALGDETTS
jgi:hypothetical protein